jgi:hypothetical protein
MHIQLPSRTGSRNASNVRAAIQDSRREGRSASDVRCVVAARNLPSAQYICYVCMCIYIYTYHATHTTAPSPQPALARTHHAHAPPPHGPRLGGPPTACSCSNAPPGFDGAPPPPKLCPFARRRRANWLACLGLLLSSQQAARGRAARRRARPRRVYYMHTPEVLRLTRTTINSQPTRDT